MQWQNSILTHIPSKLKIVDLRYHHHHMEVSKNKGCPKMDGLEWKTLFLMDDLGGKPTIFGNIHI